MSPKLDLPEGMSHIKYHILNIYKIDQSRAFLKKGANSSPRIPTLYRWIAITGEKWNLVWWLNETPAQFTYILVGCLRQQHTGRGTQEEGWHVPFPKVGTYILLGAIYSGGGQVLFYAFLHKPIIRVLVGMWVLEGPGTRVLLQDSRRIFVSTRTEAFCWCNTRSSRARVTFS